jgi:hypothetical protein
VPDQRRTRREQQHAGHAVVHALAGYPEPAPAGVIAKERCK